MAIGCFFRGLLPIIDSEIMAHFRKNMTLRQIWALVASDYLNIDLSEKNDWNTFESTNWEQSNAFSRTFLSLLVFELGGAVILTPPPPPGRRWLRPPPGRGLINDVMKWYWQRIIKHQHIIKRNFWLRLAKGDVRTVDGWFYLLCGTFRRDSIMSIEQYWGIAEE